MLVRHAQAADAPADVDRPLTAHGTRRAAAIGAWLAESGLTVGQAVVSPARRAVQTWAAAGSGPSVVDPRVYDNTVEAVLAAIRDTHEDVQQLAVVGHNPSISHLAVLLDDGQGTPTARVQLQAGFPPGGVAVFTLGTPWSDVAPGTGRLEDAALPGAG